MNTQKWLNVVVIVAVVALCIIVSLDRLNSRLAKQSEMDKKAAIDVAKLYLDVFNSHDQVAFYSLFSTRAKNRLAEDIWNDKIVDKRPILFEGVTYEIKTVEEVTCMPPEQEWFDSPLVWVKISFPYEPNGLHILFIGENGEWKIVDMF